MVTRLSYGLYQIFTQRSVRLGCLPSMSWGSRVCVLVPAHRGSQDSGAFGMGQKRGPILLVQQAWNFLLCLKVNEWDMNTEEGKTRQTPPISLFNQKLRLVTILVYLWTESHRIFAKRTILENSGCVLTRAAAQRGELPRRTVDNSENLCPSPLPGGLCTWNRKLQACFPRHPTSGKRTHSGLSAAQGLVSSHWPGKFFCSQLSENTTLC